MPSVHACYILCNLIWLTGVPPRSLNWSVSERFLHCPLCTTEFMSRSHNLSRFLSVFALTMVWLCWGCGRGGCLSPVATSPLGQVHCASTTINDRQLPATVSNDRPNLTLHVNTPWIWAAVLAVSNHQASPAHTYSSSFQLTHRAPTMMLITLDGSCIHRQWPRWHIPPQQAQWPHLLR